MVRMYVPLLLSSPVYVCCHRDVKDTDTRVMMMEIIISKKKRRVTA